MIPKLSLTGYTAHGTEENSWGPNKVENKLEDHCIKLGPQKIREREKKSRDWSAFLFTRLGTKERKVFPENFWDKPSFEWV